MDEPQAPLWRRLAWFVVIWCAGVLALGLLAGILRAWLHA